MKVIGFTTAQVVKGYKESAIARTERNDCVVRAIAAAFDIPYDDAHEICRVEFKRKHRDGTQYTALTFKSLQASGYKIGKSHLALVSPSILKKKNAQGKSLPIMVKTFLEMYPKGRYVILVSGHAFAVVDGAIIGNPRDSQKLQCRVKHAIRVL